MGKNSRNRRDAKRRKQKARRRNSTNSESGASKPAAEPDPCGCARCQSAGSSATAEFESDLIRELAWLWEHGWQPVEVVRQVRRSAHRMAVDLISVVILVDDLQRGSQLKDPLWASQVKSLRRASCVDDLGSGWLGRWLGQGPDSGSRAEASLTLIEVLADLGPIHRLIPSPGLDHVDTLRLHAEADGPDPVLAKVRALLNKAESTEFVAEAEAFTAKAQALISRHSLEDLLGEPHSVNSRPATIRVPIDEPYVAAKASLLHSVAVASRCRSIRLTQYAMCSVIGRADYLRRVEVLFTSLLVQAQGALNEVGRTDSPGSPSRSRSFRSSFLSGYAVRIGQRLLAERDRAVQSFGSDALPVIARVDSAVDDEVDRLFGDRLSSSRSSSYDALGWGTGVDAADKAQIRDGGLRSASGGQRELPEGVTRRAS